MFSILMKNNFLYERFIGCQKHRSYSGVFFGQTRANVFTTANYNKGKKSQGLTSDWSRKKRKIVTNYRMK